MVRRACALALVVCLGIASRPGVSAGAFDRNEYAARRGRLMERIGDGAPVCGRQPVPRLAETRPEDRECRRVRRARAGGECRPAGVVDAGGEPGEAGGPPRLLAGLAFELFGPYWVLAAVV